MVEKLKATDRDKSCGQSKFQRTIENEQSCEYFNYL